MHYLSVKSSSIKNFKIWFDEVAPAKVSFTVHSVKMSFMLASQFSG